jgi:hypothetical protein
MESVKNEIYFLRVDLVILLNIQRNCFVKFSGMVAPRGGAWFSLASGKGIDAPVRSSTPPPSLHTSPEPPLPPLRRVGKHKPYRTRHYPGSHSLHLINPAVRRLRIALPEAVASPVHAICRHIYCYHRPPPPTQPSIHSLDIPNCLQLRYNPIARAVLAVAPGAAAEVSWSTSCLGPRQAPR